MTSSAYKNRIAIEPKANFSYNHLNLAICYAEPFKSMHRPVQGV